MTNSAKIKIENEEKELFLKDKKFSTGSVGFNASGKMLVGDKKYQITVNIVEIGSKSKRR